MTEAFMRESLPRGDQRYAWRSGMESLAIMNPNKFRAAEFLLRHHLANGDRVSGHPGGHSRMLPIVS